LAVAANEPSENVTVLFGVIHDHLTEVFFPSGSKQTRDSYIFLGTDLSDWNAPRGVQAQPRLVQFSKSIAGWSSSPSRREQDDFTACLNPRNKH
jgi:hypothetical protein